jgi:hypothetical protein
MLAARASFAGGVATSGTSKREGAATALVNTDTAWRYRPTSAGVDAYVDRNARGHLPRRGDDGTSAGANAYVDRKARVLPTRNGLDRKAQGSPRQRRTLGS